MPLTKCVLCDFFADLDKLDIDSKLQEIDRVLAAIDRDEDVDLDKKGSGKAGGEKNVGGEDSDVGDALDALSSLLGGKAECKFTCPNGDVPKPRPGHRPSSNGCGSYGIQIDVDEIPGGTKCCDVHDKCYDTCNNDRATCDKKFKECLYDSCKGLRKTGKISFKDCKAASDIMYSGANTFGCGSYREASRRLARASHVTTGLHRIRQTSRRQLRNRKIVRASNQRLRKIPKSLRQKDNLLERKN
ncbi:group XIIB secretory phospholipase A2-like protein [Mya arenaria]|uniref:group XIIB secretory phospholipase A2-like protein n=1 Tax=Mya arenaria TaxID=6604 RepID=UPI0022E475BB|nr:group XIIB secretory phospholipase A2-like protein [Mya arenaria]